MTGEPAMDTASAGADTAPAGGDAGTNVTADTGGDTQARQPLSGGEVGDTNTAVTDFALPDAYKEKSWASKVKNQDDLYKLIDNQEGLIGKKTIHPIDYENASAEEIAAHHSKIAPEDVSAYTWAEHSMPEITEPMGAIFKEAGIHPKQAELITSKFDEVIGQLAAGQLASDTSEDGYFKIMEESFGDNFKKEVAFVENNLRQHASDDDKKLFDGVDNNTRAAIDRTVHNILKAYGANESGAQGEGGNGSPAIGDVKETQTNLRQEIRSLSTRPHSADEKQALIDKLNATYKV